MCLKGDIQSDLHVHELLDEYAIRLLFEWMCNKIDCIPYATDLQSGSKVEPTELSKVCEELLAYPFLNTRAESISQELRYRCDQLLAESFDANAELAGALYEQICNRPLRHCPDTLVDLQPDIQESDSRRAVGQFYTPPNIVRYCFDRYLESDSNKFISALQSLAKPLQAATQGQADEAPQEGWRLLDPACGSGNFLIGAIKVASQYIDSQSTLIRFCRSALYGIELDGKAASIARLCLLLETASRCPALARSPEQIKSLMLALQQNIVVCDTALLATTLSSTGHSGQSARADRCDTSTSLSSDSFDLVITNPPYVSFGSRGQPDLLPAQHKLLKSAYPAAAEYKVRLHSIFQDIALRFCKPQGNAVLLVPDGFLTGSFYARLRNLLLSRSTIVSLSELPESTIAGAVVGRWCVAQYRKNGLTQATGADSDYSVVLHSHCDVAPVHYRAKLKTLLYSDKKKIRLLFHQLDEEIFAQIASATQLGSRFRGHTGIRSRGGQKAITAGERRGPSWQRGIKSGAQVRPYQTEWDGTWLNIEPSLLYTGGFDKDVIENDKVMVRQTGDRLIAAVEQSGLYHLNNVHSFSAARVKESKQDAPLDPFYICALMNSALWLFLYQMNTRERSRALAQIDIETVESLPLPEFDSRLATAIAALSRIAHEERSPNFRRGIDRLVYDSYGLNETYIDHIENYYNQVNHNFEPSRQPLPDSSEAFRAARSEVISEVK